MTTTYLGGITASVADAPSPCRSTRARFIRVLLLCETLDWKFGVSGYEVLLTFEGSPVRLFGVAATPFGFLPET